MDDTRGIDAEDLLTHLDWLGALARHLVLDPDRAKDLVQDTCVVALRKSPPDPSGLRAWLSQVLRNLQRQHVRSEERARTREASAARPSATDATSEIAERVALQRELARLVLELEEPGRAVILLRYYSGLPPREIAERLGVSVAVVNGRLQRALARLRTRLGDEPHWSLAALGALLLAPPTHPAPAGLAKILPIGAWTVAAGTAASTAIKLGIGVVLILALGVSAWLVLPAAKPNLANAVPGIGVEAPSEPQQSAPAVGGERLALDAQGEAPQEVLGATPSPLPHVSIYVTEPSGAPIRGAQVEVTGPDPLGTFSGDDGGLCRLPVEVSTGVLELRVSADGYVAQRQRLGRAEQVRVVLWRSANVHGRVVTAEDGTAVVGAQVALLNFGDMFAEPAPESASDGAGQFELRGVPVGQARWWSVRAEGFATLTRELDVRDPSVEVELPLSRGVQLELLVEDVQSGEPVEGAAIKCESTTVRTDGQGLASTSAFLGVTDPDAELEISAHGYCSLHAVIRASELQPGAPVRLALLKGVQLQCQVTDASGAPLQGALAVIGGDSKFRRSPTDTSPRARDLVTLPEGWRISDGLLSVESLTDERGTFEMNGLEPFSPWYQVRLQRDGHWLTG
jgi:RNA polymerase sigma factor (sigma-70 family)